MRTILFWMIMFLAYSASASYGQDKKVLIHYMLWYGDSLSVGNDSLRHWQYGHENTPVVSRYDSRSRSLLTYHVLLLNSCGIDGMVANVKDEYDEESFRNLVKMIREIRNLDSMHFNFSYSISYDDQRYDPKDTLKLESDFIYLRDSLLPDREFLRYNDTACIFVFDYDPVYLSVRDYHQMAEKIFPDRTPKLAWNESMDTVMGYVDICYPWVQPYAQEWDTVYGLEWGRQYLEDFFWRINNIPQQHNSSLLFACSGVWPGFNDTCNTQWGGNRWMDRQDGQVYDSTWLLTMNYSYPLPLNWVIIETFNDFNEGSEIEPTMEYGSQYMDATIQHINEFKQTSVNPDDNRYIAARKIYDAGCLIEHSYRDSIECYAVYENAIKKFLINDFNGSIASADSILNDCCTCNPVSDIEAFDISSSLEVYPNPANGFISIRLKNSGIKRTFFLVLIDTEGKEIKRVKINQPGLIIQYKMNVKELAPGFYVMVLTDGKYTGRQKVMIK